MHWGWCSIMKVLCISKVPHVIHFSHCFNQCPFFIEKYSVTIPAIHINEEIM